MIFLSTPSARRATRSFSERPVMTMDFYPRPPRGGRRVGLVNGRPVCNFYPRPPRGGRLLLLLGVTADGLISIHALREEGDPI